MNTLDNHTNRFRTQGEAIFEGVPSPLEAVSVVKSSNNILSYKIYPVRSSAKTPNNINSCKTNLDQANRNLDRKSGLKFARNQRLSNFTGESKVGLNALCNRRIAVSGGSNCFSKSAWYRATCSARRAPVQNLRHKLGTSAVLARGFRAYGCDGMANGSEYASNIFEQMDSGIRAYLITRILSIQAKSNSETTHFPRCKKEGFAWARSFGRNLGRSEVI